MKLSHWIMLLGSFFLGIFTLLFVYTEMLQAQTKSNTETELLLIESCRAALNQGKMNEDEMFGSEADREAAVEAFYDLFCTGKGYAGASREQAYYYIPCIFLVDNDGYYVAYTTTYLDNKGATIYKQLITDKNTWTKRYGNYLVRYTLGDYVIVTDGNGEEKKGNPEKVYFDLGNPVALSFLNDYDSFEAEKRSVIRDITNEKVNYFINTHNTFFNKLNQDYVFSMPEIDSAIERMMDKPSVISFCQGMQIAHTKGYVNVFALAGSIETPENLYYLKEVDGTLYYHSAECSHLTASDLTCGQTMDDCAQAQAYACPDCIR